MEDAPGVHDKKTPNGMTNTASILGPLKDGHLRGNFGGGSNSIAIVALEHPNSTHQRGRKEDPMDEENENSFQATA